MQVLARRAPVASASLGTILGSGNRACALNTWPHLAKPLFQMAALAFLGDTLPSSVFVAARKHH